MRFNRVFCINVLTFRMNNAGENDIAIYFLVGVDIVYNRKLLEKWKTGKI